MTRGVRESRPNCPAELHDSSGAYTHHRCRCPEAIRVRQEQRDAARERHLQKYGVRRVSRAAPVRHKVVEDLLEWGSAVTDARPKEKREAIRILLGNGWVARDIAEHVGTSVRTVSRVRTEEHD